MKSIIYFLLMLAALAIAGILLFIRAIRAIRG